MEDYLETQTLSNLDFFAKEKIEKRLRENFIYLQEFSPLYYDSGPQALEKKEDLSRVFKDRGVQRLMLWTSEGSIKDLFRSDDAPEVSFIKKAFDAEKPYFYLRIAGQLFALVKAEVYGVNGRQFLVAMSPIQLIDFIPLFELTQSQFAVFSIGSEKEILQHSLKLSAHHNFKTWLSQISLPPDTSKMNHLHLGSSVFRSYFALIGVSPDETENYFIATLNESATNYKPLKIYRGRLVLIFLFTVILSLYFGFHFLNDQKLNEPESP